MNKKNLLLLHKTIGLWAFVGLIIWAVSAISHPLMSWLGPQSMQFIPPSIELNESMLQQFIGTAETHINKNDIRVIKLVQSKDGPRVQITKDEKSPREYYSLEDSTIIENYDQIQAQWLAQYYTGMLPSTIENIEFVDAFTSDYPSVNRLLPVYKVSYQDSRKTTAYIYTETGSLAALSNETKNQMQWFFQNFHTFKWLDTFDNGRVILIALFMITLTTTAIVGFMLILSIKSRKIPNGKRRFHRKLSYIIWLPLLAWSSSGFYHLIQSAYIQSPEGLRLGQTLPSNIRIDPELLDLPNFNHIKINSVSVVTHNSKDAFLRISIAPTKPSKSTRDEFKTRNERFDGKPREDGSYYINLSSPTKGVAMNDKSYITALAMNYEHIQPEQIRSIDKVTHYGPLYDFRNKRLPVWSVSLNNDEKSLLFIDPITGILVDKNRQIDRIEGWSFSILHKWSVVTPIVGRFIRDLLIIAMILIILLSSSLGLVMALKSKKKRKSQESSLEELKLLADI